MKLTGENKINASPEEVWRALNDPEILKQAIPGCDTLEKLSDTAFKATVTTKIGPVQAKFNGEVELLDLDPPNGYTISGKGSGGVAGNARGSAKVKLEPDGTGTKLSYDVDAQVTGKLAQLGSRLIDSTAKMLAGQFFNKFEQLVSKPAEAAPAAVATAATAAKPAAAGAHSAAAPSGAQQGASKGIPAWVWAVVISACIVLFSFYFKK
jgi:carbon monoxide dehydrogenase subunit G